MRGYSYPCGFILYEQEEVIVEIEDLPSLAKFGSMLMGIAFLLSVVQTLIPQMVLSILMFVCVIKTFYYETSEWHATEHKLIYLLENNCSLTTSNLKKITMKHERCGIRNRFLREPSLRKINMAIEAGEKYLNTQ